MKPYDLPAAWRARAEELRRYAPAAAEAFEECAEQLQRAQLARDNEELTLRQAAVESGFHEDALGKMVKEGRIPNAGKKGAPKILRRHVPKKPPSGKVAEGKPSLHLDSHNRRAQARRAGRGG